MPMNKFLFILLLIFSAFSVSATTIIEDTTWNMQEKHSTFLLGRCGYPKGRTAVFHPVR
jgi:hypothetical protein